MYLEAQMTISLLIGLILPCLLTTLGSSLIFVFRNPSEKWNNLTNSLSAGIMFSASIFSLLIPAIESAENSATPAFVPVVVGFLFGIFLIVFLDFFISAINRKKRRKFSKIIKILPKKPQKMAKKLNFLNFSSTFSKNGTNLTERKRAFKFFWAITIHNIPEGLCVGLAIGSTASGVAETSAIILALGIALQNFPEGLATALPLKKSLHSNKKAFLLAFLSGVVEPISAIFGFFLSSLLTDLLPYFLAFSAGAMIFVVVEEFLPETKNATWAFMLGFLFMMILDLAL